MRDVVLILLTLTLSFMAIRRPVVGMLAFVGYGLLSPHVFTWGIARSMPHSLILAVCTIIGVMFNREAKTIPLEKETILLVLLWALFGVSTVFAIEQEAASRQYLLVTKILFMVLLSTTLIRSEENLHALFRVIGLALGVYAIKGGVWFFRTGGEGTVEAPEGGFLSANNSLGVALVMNLAFLYYLVKAEDNPWLRRLFQLMFWLSYPAILGTYSRGAWLGAGAVSVLLFLRVKHKFALIAASVVLFVVISPWFSGMGSERLQQRAGTLQNMEAENSAQQRLDSWTYCFRVGLQSPVFGGGFDFHSRSTIEKYYPEILDRWEGKVWSCHSSWFTLWSEHGIPGFLVWLALLMSSLATVKSLKYKLRTVPKDSNLHLWPALLQGSIVGYLVSATFVDFAYFDLFFQIVAAIVILSGILNRKLRMIQEGADPRGASQLRTSMVPSMASSWGR